MRLPAETAFSTQTTRTRTQKLNKKHLTPIHLHTTTMENAELYHRSNNLQKRDALLCLEKDGTEIKWKENNNRILDIGCGDGSVTNMLKKYIPTKFTLLGCDVSEKMVNFANDHHCNEQTSFTVLDIESALPEGMKGNFDQVFSFYALHWIMNQKRAFNNIYELLDEDGDCFMIFLASVPLYDIYRQLARHSRWRSWLQNVDQYISPYHDSQEPDKEIKKMMELIGFVDVDVKCKDMVFMYEDIEMMIKAIKAVNPFKIPKGLKEDFMKDFLNVMEEMRIIDQHNLSSHPKAVTFNYRLLVVHGRKMKRNKISNIEYLFEY